MEYSESPDVELSGGKGKSNEVSSMGRTTYLITCSLVGDSSELLRNRDKIFNVVILLLTSGAELITWSAEKSMKTN